MLTDASSTISALQSELSSLHKMLQHMSQPAPTPPTWQAPPGYMPYHPNMFCHQMVHPPRTSPGPAPSTTSQTQKRKCTFYCWTHSVYFYSSNRCMNKMQGHQDLATMGNRMGGSLKNVQNSGAQESSTSGIGKINKLMRTFDNILTSFLLGLFSPSIIPPHTKIPQTTAIIKANSGVSRHYIQAEDEHLLQHLQSTTGPSVYLPNMSKILATKKGFLPFKHL